MYLDQKNRQILHFAKKAERKKDLGRLLALIANYGPLESIEEAKRRFLEKTRLKIEALRSFCTKVSHLESHWELLENNPGLHGFDEISCKSYLFLDPLPSNFTLLEELCAIEHYQELPCTQSSGPQLVSLGRCRVGQKRLILLSLGREKSTSLEKNPSPPALAKLAKALGELHSFKPPKKASLDDKEIAKEKKVLDVSYQLLMKSLPFEEQRRLQRAYESCIQGAKASNYRSAPAIHQLHFHELFHSHQKIFFMNLSKARLKEGYPPRDYCHAIWQIQSSLREGFKKNYLDAGGQIPSIEQQRRLFAYFLIEELKKAFFQKSDTACLFEQFDDLVN